MLNAKYRGEKKSEHDSYRDLETYTEGYFNGPQYNAHTIHVLEYK